MPKLTTSELVSVGIAAERLAISPQRVRWLIAHGRLAARSVSRFWVIEAAELARFARRKRPVGRPRKKRA